MTGYTKVDNWLFDIVMPNAKPNTYKIVSAVMRCTAGWKKDCDKISMSQFHDLTGIASRSTLIDAIQDALDEGFIDRQSIGNSYEYQLKIGTETVPIDNGERYRNSTDDGTETVPKIGTETVHTKEKRKENIKIKWDDVLSMLDYFTEVSHIKQPMLGDAGWEPHQEKWIDPIMNLLEVNDYDCQVTRQKISRAVKLMREKELIIATPKSIYNVALSINGSTSEKVGRPKGGGLYV